MTEDKLHIEPLQFPWRTQNPFLFCAFHNDRFPEGDGSLGMAPEKLQGRNIGQDFSGKDGWSMYHGMHIPGFPYHPHRGFETITIVNEGVIDHSDSLGGKGRFAKGDTQWMTAGKGVLHSEMFPLMNPDEDNPLQLFQIWLNLPRQSKMVEPHYKMLWKENVPVYTHQDQHGKEIRVTLIAGSLENIQPMAPPPDSWAADPSNHVAVWEISMDPHAEWSVPGTEEGLNRSLFFYEGDVDQIGDKEINFPVLVEYNSHEPIHIKNGTKESRLLYLQGKPINEPVVQYGPFVMNTRQEIQEAFEDYRETEFGGWPWPVDEMVHGKEFRRFALHADGTEEAP